MNATTSTEARGLTLTILRSGSDCTNGGVSAKAETLTLVGTFESGDKEITPLPRQAHVFAPRTESPAVALCVRNLMGERLLTIVPVEEHDGRFVPPTSWVMAGGNFAHSSDSRMTEVLREAMGHGFYGALAIHDRIEHR